MNVTITPSALGGEIAAIPSKSVAHRALICAALADKPTKILNLFPSSDIMATTECIKALGAKFEKDTVYPIKKTESAVLDCNESGSTFRFMLPLSLALGGNFSFKLGGRLPARPISPLYGELSRMGATLSPEGTNPFKAQGKLKSGVYNLPGNVSSQFITGLLLALPLLDGDSEIKIYGRLESAPYIDITRSIQENFSVISSFENNTFYIKGNQKYISPDTFTVEGDWSNGAFWYVADYLSENKVSCTGLMPSSPQGDKAIADILPSLPCTVDAADIPDLIPIICAAASLCKGSTKIINAQRLIIKESNRIEAIYKTLSTLGADIKKTDDGLEIFGKDSLCGGIVDSFNDHRIVMMAAIASIKCKEAVTILNAQAANKSYPGFFDDFKKLGGKIEVTI